MNGAAHQRAFSNTCVFAPFGGDPRLRAAASAGSCLVCLVLAHSGWGDPPGAIEYVNTLLSRVTFGCESRGRSWPMATLWVERGRTYFCAVRPGRQYGFGNDAFAKLCVFTSQIRIPRVVWGSRISHSQTAKR